MRVAVNSHALPIYKKNRIASLLCIFETTIIAVCIDRLLLSFILMGVCGKRLVPIFGDMNDFENSTCLMQVFG